MSSLGPLLPACVHGSQFTSHETKLPSQPCLYIFFDSFSENLNPIMKLAQGQKISSLDSGKWKGKGSGRCLCLSRRGREVFPRLVLPWPVLLLTIKTAGDWRCRPIVFPHPHHLHPDTTQKGFCVLLNTGELLDFQLGHEHFLQVFQILNLLLETS